MRKLPLRRVLPVWLEPTDFHQASGYWRIEVGPSVYRLDLLVKHPFLAAEDRMMSITVRLENGVEIPEGMPEPQSDEEDGA